MRKGFVESWALAASLIAAPALAQKMPDIGFESVGRGRPLASSVLDYEQEVGPNWIREFRQAPGPDVKKPFPMNGYLPTDVPKDYKPLARDIFSSKDFYADKELWSDPRYFRCNSPQATEYQRGVLAASRSEYLGEHRRRAVGALRHQPTARGHREPVRLQDGAGALRGAVAETTKRGGPSVYTYENFPNAEWNGVYQRPNSPGGNANQTNWYWGRHTQIPTVLSLLTPKYQEWLVQEAYHQVRGNALWPSTFCWPEGFMRRWYPAAVWEHYVIATPDLVHVRAGVARNFIQDIYVGREFNMEDVAKGGVPVSALPCRAGMARRSASGTRTC